MNSSQTTNPYMLRLCNIMPQSMELIKKIY
jgi:hypothetical protein